MANLNHAVDLIQSFKEVAADRNISDRKGFDLGQVTEQIVGSLRSGLRSHDLTFWGPDGGPNLAMNSYPEPVRPSAHQSGSQFCGARLSRRNPRICPYYDAGVR